MPVKPTPCHTAIAADAARNLETALNAQTNSKNAKWRVSFALATEAGRKGRTKATELPRFDFDITITVYMPDGEHQLTTYREYRTEAMPFMRFTEAARQIIVNCMEMVATDIILKPSL